MDNSIISISNKAYEGAKCKYITFSNNLKYIGQGAFANCEELTENSYFKWMEDEEQEENKNQYYDEVLKNIELANKDNKLLKQYGGNFRVSKNKTYKLATTNDEHMYSTENCEDIILNKMEEAYLNMVSDLKIFNHRFFEEKYRDLLEKI